MRIRNKSEHRLKRTVNGCWTIVKPGDVITLEPNEAQYLMSVERGYWEDADVPVIVPTPEPESVKEPAPEQKPKPKKGGE